MDTNKVKRWMEGVVIKALNEFPKHNGQYVIRVPVGTFYVKYLLLLQNSNSTKQ